METQPHGTWKSPITPSMIVKSAIKLGDIALDGGSIYWNEIRPEEKGRSVIVSNGKDLLPEGYSARSRVHEYGGAPFTVHNGTVYFVNDKDQKLYKRDPNGEIFPLCGGEGLRYANPLFDPKRNVLYAVQEEHRADGEVINTLVKVDNEAIAIHEGHDFYAMPTLHPEGTHLAFITWDHPNMPWDGSTLWVGEIAPDGTLFNVKKEAGGISESIFQPEWSPDGTLHYVSDRTGWWNLYPGPEMEAEFGQPLWVFGMTNYGFFDDGRIAAVYTIKGKSHLGIIHGEELEKVDLSFTSYGSFKVSGNRCYFTAASSTEPQALYSYEKGELTCLKKLREVTCDNRYISIAKTIECKGTHGFFYSPKNPDYKGNDLPPLIVKCHGGPSGHTNPSLNLENQYWTSRGFAYLDVNYGGSTGHGRAYRERLKGTWGKVDVEDCINAALYCAEKGWVDRERMAIKGGSSGGYTTLAALTFHDTFKAGVSYYGVSDLEALANDTHKYEAHYLDGLIGPYPEEKERYRALSPLHHADQISAPLLLLQGSEDRVVPPNQSEMLIKALKTPVTYILFEGEGHGFRQAENIKKALEAELNFYGKTFGFEM
ncbi:prolyl oligopeptidase family serine peptidase [Candidatus Neptunochlamydia vexilliferae]|uniref:Peptidase S9 prolyl oligopeptidase catalytic domain-containing protein n=1 Tax=Candidatus Neptunichlamydia vexilliferae TaxID=1651774 RepID=A0ABS0B0R7_9BACT|nr:prolyl oligopeptidase family serine peptidase [Candidatus Neptunochlamydia vexilliferae]MBF5059996.1 hypothetical protein [Candidatus Neptunochlamydia vexilliferae]